MIAFCFQADPFFCITLVHSLKNKHLLCYCAPATALGQMNEAFVLFLGACSLAEKTDTSLNDRTME